MTGWVGGARSMSRVSWVNRMRMTRWTSWLGVGLAGALAACGDGAPADASSLHVRQCESASVPYLPVRVTPTLYSGAELSVRLEASGFGPSPVPSADGNGDAPAEGRGWLELGVLAEVKVANGARPSGNVTSTVYYLAGPRALAELPLAIGAELDLLLIERPASYMPGEYRVVLRQGEHVLLFHGSSLEEGFTLAQGDELCGMPSFPNCANTYRYNLEVTVPGGTTATLAPGQSQVAGDYFVQGSMSSIDKYAYESCPSDLYDGWVNIDFTAVLLPEAL
jgi:hypothetical protein